MSSAFDTLPRLIAMIGMFGLHIEVNVQGNPPTDLSAFGFSCKPVKASCLWTSLLSKFIKRPRTGRKRLPMSKLRRPTKARNRITQEHRGIGVAEIIGHKLATCLGPASASAYSGRAASVLPERCCLWVAQFLSLTLVGIPGETNGPQHQLSTFKVARKRTGGTRTSA